MDKIIPSGPLATYRRERQRGRDHDWALRETVHAFGSGVASRERVIAEKVARIQHELDSPIHTPNKE